MTEHSSFPLRTPPPPYFAVIFSFRVGNREPDQYMEKLRAMNDLASQLPEFLGEEAIRREDGSALSVSYWSSAEGIEKWRQHPEHVLAKNLGRSVWYDAYELRIAEVHHARSFRREALD